MEKLDIFDFGAFEIEGRNIFMHSISTAIDERLISTTIDERLISTAIDEHSISMTVRHRDY